MNNRTTEILSLHLIQSCRFSKLMKIYHLQRWCNWHSAWLSVLKNSFTS